METKQNTSKTKLENEVQLTNKMVPLLLDLDVVGQATFHDVEAVVVARFDVGVPLTDGARVHLLDGSLTFRTRGNLKIRQNIVFIKPIFVIFYV